MATVAGEVYYAQVVGSSLKDRSCFDGTVPRCFTCSAYVSYLNSTASVAAGEALFSLTGVPRNASYAVGTADTHRYLTSKGIVSLRDVWLLFEGESSAANTNFRIPVTVTLAVYNPEDAFPDAANTNYVYQSEVFLSSDNSTRKIRIPDFDGLIVNEHQNVVCRLSFAGGGSTIGLISFHAVSVIDD